MFFSKEKMSFYIPALHGANMPADAVKISKDLHASLLDGMSSGKRLAATAEGLPILIDPPIKVPTADDHRAAVAAERYKRETAGIMVGDMAIDSGRDSQALITGAAVAAMLDPAYSCNWKTPAGFVQLDAAQIIAVASAVRAHVQACFDREGEILGAIELGTYTEAMLEEGWP